MPEVKQTFMKRAREWATRHGLFGPQAFLRYVMFTFLDSLNSTSKDFVFKGGNLLWTYIQTPRATVDLDVATLTLDADPKIRKILEKACTAADGISFAVKSFESVSSVSKRGASAIIAYKTDQGAASRNKAKRCGHIKLSCSCTGSCVSLKIPDHDGGDFDVESELSELSNAELPLLVE